MFLRFCDVVPNPETREIQFIMGVLKRQLKAVGTFSRNKSHLSHDISFVISQLFVCVIHTANQQCNQVKNDILILNVK